MLDLPAQVQKKEILSKANVPVVVKSAADRIESKVNQQTTPEFNRVFHSVGRLKLQRGETVSNTASFPRCRDGWTFPGCGFILRGFSPISPLEL